MHAQQDSQCVTVHSLTCKTVLMHGLLHVFSPARHLKVAAVKWCWHHGVPGSMLASQQLVNATRIHLTALVRGAGTEKLLIGMHAARSRASPGPFKAHAPPPAASGAEHLSGTRSHVAQDILNRLQVALWALRPGCCAE